MGVEVISYKDGSDSSRLEKLNSLDRVKFSRSETFGENKKAAENGGKVQNSDEERTFSYDELVTKPPLLGITVGKDVQVPLKIDGSIDRNAIVSKVRKQCQKIQTKSATPTCFLNAPDIGRNVEITDRSITHGFFAGTNKNKTPSPKDLINAKVSLKIGAILENSIEVNRSYRKGNRDILYAHIMVGTIGIVNADGKTDYYAVRTVIEERTNLNPILVESKIIGKLHAINAKKIDSPNLKVADDVSVARGHDDVYEYSVANFLADVKSVFDDTFSEDVYAHFNMNRRTTRGFSEHLQYSRGDAYDPFEPYTPPAYAMMPEYSAPLEGRYEYQGEGYTAANGLKLFSKYSVDTARDYIMSELMLTEGKTELARDLNEFYTFMATAKKLDWSDIYKTAKILPF